MSSQKTKSLAMLMLMMCGVSSVNMAPLPKVNFNSIITNTRNDVNDRFNRMRLEVLMGIGDGANPSKPNSDEIIVQKELTNFFHIVRTFYKDLLNLDSQGTGLMAKWVETSKALFKIFDDEGGINKIQDLNLKLFVKSQLCYMVSTLNLMFIVHEDNEIDALSNSLRIMINFSDTRLRLKSNADNDKKYLGDVKKYAETLARDTLVNLGKIGKNSKKICEMYIAKNTDSLSQELGTAFAEARQFDLVNIKNPAQEGQKEKLKGMLGKINLIVNLLEILVLKQEMNGMLKSMPREEGATPLTADVDEVNQMDCACQMYVQGSLQNAAVAAGERKNKEALAARRQRIESVPEGQQTGVNGRGALQMGTSTDVSVQRPGAVRFNDKVE